VTPLVSIIVICHDYAHFLAEAIESALAQTYRNREVVVIDDGSTDDSVEVASRYGESIRLLTQPNLGLERTCNRAVGEARGEYFAFLSADDVLEPTYVERLLDALRRSPDASFAYCRGRMFGARTGLTKCCPYSAYILVKRMNYINASALTARDDYLAVGGYAEELAGNTLEDWDFWLRMLEHGKRGTYVRAPLLRWRRHTSGSRNVQEQARLTRTVETIRARHRPLIESMAGTRGRLAYVADLCVAGADLVLGLSRSTRLLQTFERRSWRRYLRGHPPDRARAGSR
jgi:glycosyltransferase involved in cell wall biosynthesis